MSTGALRALLSVQKTGLWEAQGCSGRIVGIGKVRFARHLLRIRNRPGRERYRLFSLVILSVLLVFATVRTRSRAQRRNNFVGS